MIKNYSITPDTKAIIKTSKERAVKVVDNEGAKYTGLLANVFLKKNIT